MNITAGEKVTLNPKNRDERIALRVAAYLTGSEKLQTLVDKYTGKGEGNADSASHDPNEPIPRDKFMDFFNDESVFVDVMVVFRKMGKDA
jgi:hypothetical protein